MVLLYGIFLVIFLSVIYYKENIQKYVTYKRYMARIGGPKQNLILGNLLSFFLLDPAMCFTKIREVSRTHGPVYRLSGFFYDSLNISGPEEYELIVSSMKNIEKGPVYKFFHHWLGQGLLTSDGTLWQSRRKILTPAFHFSILQKFVVVFNEETNKLIDILKGMVNTEINVVPLISQFTLNSIAESSMGTSLDLKNQEHKNYVQAIFNFGKIIFYRFIRPWWYTASIYYTFSTKGIQEKEIVNILHNFTSKIIKKRAKNFVKFEEENEYAQRSKLAMLDLLLNAQLKDGIIDEQGIRDEVNTFMFEGQDTTAMSICFTLMLLAYHRDVQDLVYKEMIQLYGDSKEHLSLQELNDLKYMEMVIKESLRLYPSVPFIQRILSEDIRTKDGQLLPKGAPTNIHLFDIHRNPNYWPNPDIFDPNRFLLKNCNERHSFCYVPFSAGPRNCIEFFFKKLRNLSKQYGPAYHISVTHLASVNISGAHEFELVTSSIKHLKKGYMYWFLENWLGKGLLTSTGSKWQTRRKILTPAFHFSILQKFVAVFNKETDKLTKLLKTKENIDLNVVPLISQFTLSVIAETAMGTTLDMKNEEDMNYVLTTFKLGKIVFQKILRPWYWIPIVYDFTSFGRLERRLVKVLHKFTAKIIDERSKNFVVFEKENEFAQRTKLAMLDLLLNAKLNDGIIDDRGIHEEVNTFMFEGHDTTSMSICFTLMLLAYHKDVQDLVYKEIIQTFGYSKNNLSINELGELKYMEMVIKESLRLYPSVPSIARILEEDITTRDGLVFPKGILAHLHIFDIHRNPTYWPVPEKFDPDRFLPENCVDRHPFAYVPFSAGSRNCIGQKFAMLEMKSTLYGILRNFLVLPVDTPETVVLMPDIVLRTKHESLRLKFVSRS